jgi:rSAM/selenodomain-associated transferase 1
MSDAAVIVFARVPRLGEVKSRIAARMGPELALSVHRQLLRRVLEQVTELEASVRELCIAGADSDGECASLAREFGLSIATQVGKDLGERMYQRLAHHNRLERRAVLVGADCPWLRSCDLRQALDALEQHEHVFAPAFDGGYVLVGSRCARPEVFQEIVWGSSRVMSQTLEQLARLNARAFLLPSFRDVDEWDDWLAWVSETSHPAGAERNEHGGRGIA